MSGVMQIVATTGGQLWQSPALGRSLVLWLDADDTSTITLNGSNVSQWSDKSRNNYHASQAVATDQPLYTASPGRITFGTSDRLITNLPATTGTLVFGTTNGTAAYRVNIPSGNYDIGRRGGGNYMPDGTAYGYILSNSVLSESEIAFARAYIQSKGAGDNYGSVTDFTNYWRNWSEIVEFPLINTSAGTNFHTAWFSCTSLTSFPLIDTSAGTNFSYAWHNCISLASFPLIDTSSGTYFSYAWQYCSRLTSFPLIDTSSGTNFVGAWQFCSRLASFPANFFNGCSATNFTGAFNATNLSQQSIDDILVSIESNGTSSGTFNQSGGSAPSATGEAAITALRGRGWNVTVTGGF